jgi:hypothetical protein
MEFRPTRVSGSMADMDWAGIPVEPCLSKRGLNRSVFPPCNLQSSITEEGSVTHPWYYAQYAQFTAAEFTSGKNQEFSEEAGGLAQSCLSCQTTQPPAATNSF